MASCTACSSTILFGGENNRFGTFCDASCISKYCIATTVASVPQQDIDKVVNEEFHKNCPACSGAGPLDLHKATKVTSYLIAYTISSESRIGCRSCGRKMKLKAGLHTLFLGIWSPKGLVCSLFVFPAGLIGAAITGQPKAPSKAFNNAIKEHIGQNLLAQAKP
jgi:hypothetical protein